MKNQNISFKIACKNISAFLNWNVLVWKCQNKMFQHFQKFSSLFEELSAEFGPNSQIVSPPNPSISSNPSPEKKPYIFWVELLFAKENPPGFLGSSKTGVSEMSS